MLRFNLKVSVLKTDLTLFSLILITIFLIVLLIVFVVNRKPKSVLISDCSIRSCFIKLLQVLCKKCVIDNITFNDTYLSV